MNSIYNHFKFWTSLCVVQFTLSMMIVYKIVLLLMIIDITTASIPCPSTGELELETKITRAIASYRP